MTVYDISKPGATPNRLLAVEGGGVHRIWYVGGRWAYASALLDGFTDYIFITIDMTDPTQPREAGRYWLPGMNAAAGESRAGTLQDATACITRSFTATPPIAAWRDAGLVVIDVATARIPSSSFTATGRRPSAAGPIIACRCPTATFSLCSTRQSWTIRKTV